MGRKGTSCWYVMAGELHYEDSHSLLSRKIDCNPVLLTEWFNRHPARWGRIGGVLIGDLEVLQTALKDIGREIERTRPNVQKTTKSKHLLTHHEYYGTAMFRNVV